ncbi:hypothetical protein HK096_009173 [Nowakowskiella sp. JEL0078]|nr:hypothetical protein HK096_009173 [Nowakowskiella sp. JEL0078]
MGNSDSSEDSVLESIGSDFPSSQFEGYYSDKSSYHGQSQGSDDVLGTRGYSNYSAYSDYSREIEIAVESGDEELLNVDDVDSYEEYEDEIKLESSIQMEYEMDYELNDEDVQLNSSMKNEDIDSYKQDHDKIEIKTEEVEDVEILSQKNEKDEPEFHEMEIGTEFRKFQDIEQNLFENYVREFDAQKIIQGVNVIESESFEDEQLEHDYKVNGLELLESNQLSVKYQTYSQEINSIESEFLDKNDVDRQISGKQLVSEKEPELGNLNDKEIQPNQINQENVTNIIEPVPENIIGDQDTNMTDETMPIEIKPPDMQTAKAKFADLRPKGMDSSLWHEIRDFYDSFPGFTERYQLVDKIGEGKKE